MLLELIRHTPQAIIVILIIAISLSVYNWKQLPKAFHVLCYYLCWNLFVEVLARALMPYKVNNLPLLHLYTILEFVLFAVFYQKTGLFSRWKTQRFWQFVGVVVVLLVLNSVFLQSIFIYNTYAKTLVQLILIAFSVGFIFQLREKSAEQSALNWANAAILIYYSGSLFVFMFANVLFYERYSILYWDANVILNLIFQLIILISIWKACKVRTYQF